MIYYKQAMLDNTNIKLILIQVSYVLFPKHFCLLRLNLVLGVPHGVPSTNLMEYQVLGVPSNASL